MITETANEYMARPEQRRVAPPRWMIALTFFLALLVLVMAVAETNLWMHYLIDAGELISLIGLGIVFWAGLLLHRQQRLSASLPLVLPWLVFPIVTQGDQIIDGMTINQMRLTCHAILAVLFGAPVVVLVLAAHHMLTPGPDAPHRHRRWTVMFPGLRLFETGRPREGAVLMMMALLLIEIWIAYQYLGLLMILTLVGMGMLVLFWATVAAPQPARLWGAARYRFGPRSVLAMFCVGVFSSFGLFLFYKNRPGITMDQDPVYPLKAIAVSDDVPVMPPMDVAAEFQAVVGLYAEALQRQSHAYYILDRNLNYTFHNDLFMRHTPVLPDFQTKASDELKAASQLAVEANSRLAGVQTKLPAPGAVLSFMQELRSQVAFNLRRADMLAQTSAEMLKTRAGCQHATHLYEREGKAMGVCLMDVLEKHRRVIDAPGLSELADPFVQAARKIHAKYSDRIVGF